MKIAEVLQHKRTLSFEVFPPKNEISMDGILNTLSHLYHFNPDFISCTYGAGGSQRGRNLEVCDAVNRDGYTVMPHLTCIGHSRDDIRGIMQDYTGRGFENLLALRGDLPAGWDSARGDFSYADDLIAYTAAAFPQLCIGAAAYPEKHLTAPSMEDDITRLRSKQDKGARFLMTQLCYDLSAFERFLERIRTAGVTIPVIVGIMPVLACDPVIRMTLSNGCSIPADLAAIIGKYQKDPGSFTGAGMEYTVNLIQRYQSTGINGLHFYSMNKWEKLTVILQNAGLNT